MNTKKGLRSFERKGPIGSKFFRGEVNKYGWVDIGSSYLLSEILAAVLYAQLELRDRIQAKRKKIWQFYYDDLCEWALEHRVQLPQVPSYCDQTYHIFYLLLPSLEKRQSFISQLKEQGISCVFHYLPLNLSKMGLQFGGKEGDCPVTEDISDRLVRLPMHDHLTEEDLMNVTTAIKHLKDV